MIKKSRRSLPSVIWQKKAEKLLEENVYQFENKRKIEISDEYRCNENKALLALDFDYKCAYCEKYLNERVFDIEHYRPKGKINNTENESLPEHGYFWLAYDWYNLFPSCELCNRKFKNLDSSGNVIKGEEYGKYMSFPLKKGSKRFINPRFHEHFVFEDPLIMNPCDSEPEELLVYLPNGYIRAKNSSVEAEETIKLLGLNFRSDLVRRRKAKIDFTIECCKGLITANSCSTCQGTEKYFIQFLKTLCSDQSEFAGASRFVLRHPLLFGFKYKKFPFEALVI